MRGAEGLRVLEIGDRVSGAFAGLVLAGQGATVCQLEVGRVRTLDALESAFFDRGRIVVDAGTGAGAGTAVGRLAALADVIVSDVGPTALESLGVPVTESGLTELRPGLVHVAVTPLGLGGPHSEFVMEGITEWASGGLAYATRRDVPGEDTAGYTPVVAPGRQPEMLAGLAGAIGALVGVRVARQCGRSVVVDVSRQEVQSSLLHSLFPQLVSDAVVAGDPDHRVAYGMLVAARDGDVYLRPLELHQWQALVEWMGSPDWAVAMVDNLPAAIPDFDIFGRLMLDWAGRFTRRELLEEGQRRRVPVALPNDLATLLASEQLHERRFWGEVDVAGRARIAPTIPLLEPEAWPERRRAQLAEVEGLWHRPPGAQPHRPPGAQPHRPPGAQPHRPPGAQPHPDPMTAPLAGVRVLDLGRSWSAPFAGMVLADLGAEVIKLESTSRIDILRFSGAFVDGVRDAEHSGYYLACNRGKRSVTLDLKRPEGRDVLLRLVDVSDVLLENFSPRVLPGLGIGADALLARNPRLVMASLSGYGATGPEGSFISYGDHLLHASGFSSLTGEPGDAYTKLATFYGDPVGGLYAALAVVAALEERDRGGDGRWLDLSQLEGLVSMLPREVMATGMGDPPGRSADKSSSLCPHGFYPCAGADTWVAIAVADDDRWGRLRALLAGAGAEVPELATAAERKAAEVVVDGFVRAYTAQRSPWEVTRACQREGVAAYPLQSTAKLLWDDHLRSRRFFSWVHRPITGPGPLPGPVLRMAEGGSRVRGYAPLLGEHNREVLLGPAGLTEEDYRRLDEAGVLA